MSSYAYRLDIRNPSTGAPVSGLTSVELRNRYAAYVFAEVGNGVYSIASIPGGRYDLYISNVSTGQSYGVGEGELAGLGYSDGTMLKSTASALQWDNKQYAAINHTHSHSSLTGINDGSYKHISSTEKGYLERANNPTGVLILNGEGKVDENNLPIIAKNHKNAGVISDPPTIIRNGNGTVTVGPCVCRLYDNAEYKGTPNDYDIAQATLTPTDRGDDWVVADYNAGNPIYRIVDAWSFTAYNVSDIVPIENVLRIGNSLHGEGQGSSGNGAIEKMVLRVGQTERYARVGGVGLVLSSSAIPAVRTVLISGAYVWDDITRVIVHDFSSATDSLYSCVRNAGVWTYTLATQWDNLYYNDNAGLVAMSNNKWGVVWIYRSIGDDKEAWMVRGTSEYNTQASANEATPRSDVDKILQSHAQLVGRIVFQKGSYTAYITSAFVGAFGVSAVTDHNNLSGIQGGTVGEYYHDNLAQHNQKVNAGAANGYALLNSSGVLPDAVQKVTSVLGRSGNVTAQSGDYTAAQVTNAPAGNISATTVQAAINELDSEKLAATTAASTYAPINATLADNAASSTLPTVASGTITSKLQQIRDYLKYLLAELGGKQATLTFDTVPTDGSTNPVTSNGVFDAIASLQPKHSTYATSAGENAGWINGITVRIPKTIRYADRQSIFNVRGYGGVLSSYQWTARVMLSIKIQDYSPSYKLVILDGDNYIGRVYGRYDQDTGYHYFTPEFYICSWGYTRVELESGDLPETFTAIYVSFLSSYSVAATVYDNYLESNTGRYGGVKLKDDGSADKDDYRGLSVGGAKRLVLLSCISEGYCGLYNETDSKWLVLSQPDGMLHTRYTPPISSDGDLIPTTAWVTSRAVPTIITANATLPAGAPIGKSVFVEDVGGSSITVTAPSGEVIAYNAASGYSSVNISNYSGVWFVKTRSNRWTVDRAL